MPRKARHLLLSLVLLGLFAPGAGAQSDAVDDQPLAADSVLDGMLLELAEGSGPTEAPAAALLAIAANPATYRGQTFHLVTGPAIRVASSAFDIAHLSAWQTEVDEVREPVLILIYEPGGSTRSDDRAASIELNAKFWKTAMATMSAGTGEPGAVSPDAAPARPAERILVFVGAEAKFAEASVDGPLAPWTALVLALLVGGAVLLMVRRMARQRRVLRPTSAARMTAEQWNDANLPDEPADALAELRRRGDDTMSHD